MVTFVASEMENYQKLLLCFGAVFVLRNKGDAINRVSTRWNVGFGQENPMINTFVCRDADSSRLKTGNPKMLIH